MSKFRYMFMMLVVIFAAVMLVPAFAEDDQDGAVTDKALKDLPRFAFIFKAADGTEYVCVRMHKGQYGKATTLGRWKAVEIHFSPLQLRALNATLKMDIKNKVILLTTNKHLQSAKLLTRGVYILRERKAFVTFLEPGKDVKEAAEPTGLPLGKAKLLADLKAVPGLPAEVKPVEPVDTKPADATTDTPEEPAEEPKEEEPK